ncbi:uncharacterized protein [Eurosta solidaginis]|uniref:uncharacterized protein isoform X2 n=1 Tax=Eurosta solidaginis TaxID=178769 RepID=UPI0035315C80
MRVTNMAGRKSRKNKYLPDFRSFEPVISRGPNQGLLNFNSWHAQVFIEILGTMLVEQDFIKLIFEPITQTYAKFVKRANRNIWSLSKSKHLVVRVKYRRHAQRLTELLGAILTKRQFITLVLKPIIKTYIDTYSNLVLGDTMYDDVCYNSNETINGSDWNCSLDAFSSMSYRKMKSWDDSITTTFHNSMSELLRPF